MKTKKEVISLCCIHSFNTLSEDIYCCLFLLVSCRVTCVNSTFLLASVSFRSFHSAVFSGSHDSAESVRSDAASGCNAVAIADLSCCSADLLTQQLSSPTAPVHMQVKILQQLCNKHTLVVIVNSCNLKVVQGWLTLRICFKEAKFDITIKSN